MNREQELQITLQKFLKTNSDLSEKEIEVASTFITALSVTDESKRYGVLRIMLDAVIKMEAFVKSEMTIDELDKLFGRRN